MANQFNCDVCGSIVHEGEVDGGLYNQLGGYACKRCVAVAEVDTPACNDCGKPVIHGDYKNLCACDGVTVTRKPKSKTWVLGPLKPFLS